VLLDEPTLGLDPASLAIIRDSVRAMNAEGVTVLMVEQNVRFGLALANHATVMSAGPGRAHRHRDRDPGPAET